MGRVAEEETNSQQSGQGGIKQSHWTKEEGARDLILPQSADVKIPSDGFSSGS